MSFVIESFRPYSIDAPFVIVENTRTVSRNLRCKKKCDDNAPANHVDVLIPEVIQV